jgi:hypothetical protein
MQVCALYLGVTKKNVMVKLSQLPWLNEAVGFNALA